MSRIAWAAVATLAACDLIGGDKDTGPSVVMPSDPDGNSGSGDTDEPDCEPSQEICNDRDDDCDGLVDDEDDDLDQTTGRPWYVDADGDGYGAGSSTGYCDDPADPGLTETEGDCDDADDTIFPGAPELCNDIDNNCDGSADDEGEVSFVSEDGVRTPMTDEFSGGYSKPFDLVFAEAGTLTFCDGEFFGTMELNAVVSVLGAGRDRTILKPGSGQNSAQIHIVSPGSDETIVVSSLTARDGDEGALAITEASVDIEDVYFYRNEAYSNGGAVQITAGTVAMTGVDFVENTSTNYNGGAVYATDDATVTVTSVTFIDNDSDDYGGAVSLKEGSDASFVGVTFDGNTSSYGGAVSVQSDAEARFSGAELISNVSARGGHLYATSGVLSVSNSTFSDGYASYGGAISLWERSTLSLDTVTLTTHYAGSEDGGTIHSSESDVTITSSSLSDSFANDNGGTIYINSGDLSISDTTIEDSSSNDKGGAIYTTLGEVALSGVAVSDSAAPGGAGLFIDDSEVTIADSAFDSNQSTSGCGGDMRIDSSVSIYLVEVTATSFSASYPDTVCLINPSPDAQYTYTGKTETFTCSPTVCK